MKSHQKDFLNLAIEMGVLSFGEFTLKSGRTSPYFFNAGLFNTGRAIATLGRCYAQAIVDSGAEFDMLFGPAYKGIPLAATVAATLADRHQVSYPWAYNRKEAKDHGEGGLVVGAPLAGRVLIIDDVITAGTAIRESVSMIEEAGAKPVAIAIALDRQERGQGRLSAVQEVEQDLAMQVIRIVGLSDLIELLAADSGRARELEAVRAYQKKFGTE